MQENENQVLTAKADDEPADAAPLSPQKAPKKKGRVLWIVLAVLGACMLFGLGALAGGGAVFGLTRARGHARLRPSVDMWVSPREMPHSDLPMRPGRDLMGVGAGAMIVEVVPGGPAEQAGLSEGDLVVAIGGEALDADSDLAALIAKHEPGDEVTIELAAFGQRLGPAGREVTVTLAEHPDAKGKAYLGVSFVPMPHDEFGMGGRMYGFGDEGPCAGCEEHDEDLDSRRERRFEFRWPGR